MLKHLAILGLLLAALPPIQGRTSRRPGESYNAVGQQADSKKADATPAPTVATPPHTQPADLHTVEINSDYAEHRVKVSSLPTVTIADKQKTVWDRMYDGGLWVFTGLLVVVGFLQVATMYWQAKLLKGTLAEIRTQATLMETQAGHMGEQTQVLKDSVSAAQTSADAAKDQIATMKQKERARISVEFVPISHLTFGWLDSDTVDMKIENFGFTHALNVRATGAAALSASTDVRARNPGEIESCNVPDVIRVGDEPKPGSISLEKRVTKQDIVSDSVRWILVVKGAVEYEDVFGDHHKTTFVRYMLVWSIKPTDHSDVFAVPDASWKKSLNPEENLAT